MTDTSFFSKVTAYGFKLTKWCQFLKQQYGNHRRPRRQKARKEQLFNPSTTENNPQKNHYIRQQPDTQAFSSLSVPKLGISGDRVPRLPFLDQESLWEDSIQVVNVKPTERTPPVPDCPGDPLPHPLPTQSKVQSPVSSIVHASAFHKRYFWSTNPALLGYIDEPEGSPPSAGGYSDVWRYRVQFSRPSEALPTEVAVKVLRSAWLSSPNDAEANARLLQRFQQEAITWLGAPNHPNIVPLIGWMLTPSLSFVSPWYKRGNLSQHLKDLSEAQRINILLGIAKGLDCLHSCRPPIVHGDLKPENVLLSDWGEPLLADFGLSTILGEEGMYSTSHGVGGTVRWMSPEQMIEGSRSCQSDVYSFGSLAFTVLTRELPHTGLLDVQILHKVCTSSDPKDPVEDWDKYPHIQGSIGNLLRECWSRSPEARPAMSAVASRLTVLLESLEP